MHSVEDTFGQLIIHDSVLILPTLKHAIALWPKYKEYAASTSKMITSTKTSIILRLHGRTLKLWVPYEREPTMPLDWPHFRRNYWPTSPWYTDRELRRMV